MCKSQLQKIGSEKCFNLPAYSCVQEGLDHTLRLAEHVAAEIALNTLANRGPSKALASKVLVVKLKAFSKFENTSEALSAATLLIDSKPSKGLRKFLRAHCDGETLAVADSKLGNAIKEKLQIECVHNNTVMELMRGVRSQLTELKAGLASQDLAPMSLGLSHSLSRYKLKFSSDKVFK
ncbi:probable nucleolar protein 5-2 isoform X2 [Rhododendron vialii]|uniref:probable nucleolar protein 5-2 isoform X2 n=1 Tax=Rhododendron vialii TaxID=182163 RepID=UPI00265F84AF|nr:probable nucleolar protein 5-2 isoform X2 [Rhododendron vialii]